MYRPNDPALSYLDNHCTYISPHCRMKTIHCSFVCNIKYWKHSKHSKCINRTESQIEYCTAIKRMRQLFKHDMERSSRYNVKEKKKR